MVWRHERSGQVAIRGRLLNRQDAWQGDEFEVASGLPVGHCAVDQVTDRCQPEIAFNENNVALVVWESPEPDGSSRRVLGRRLDVTFDTACRPGEATLCLQNRFQIETDWRDFEGETGPGRVVPGQADDSGLMWFFSADNWELLIKVLDGCAINEHFWVFAAAATDVEYTITVTDTWTGEVRTYENPLGVQSPSITDTSAFATCDVFR